MQELILKHKWKVFFLFIIYLSVAFLLFCLSTGTTINRFQSIVHFTLEYSGLIGIIVGVSQFLELRKQSLVQLNIVKLSKSIEKTEEYRELLNDCYLTSSMFKHDEVYFKKVSSIPISKMNSFRFEELIANLGDDREILNVLDYSELISRNFDRAAYLYKAFIKSCSKEEKKQIAIYSRYDWSSNDIRKKKFGISDENLEKVKNMKEIHQELKERIKTETGEKADETREEIQKLKALRNRYLEYTEYKSEMEMLQEQIKEAIHNSMEHVLNKLESWAMAFNVGLADQDTVYNSLHQSYLETVKYLYPIICVFNSKGVKDQYYTHVTNLFIEWRDRDNNNHELENKSNTDKYKYASKL